MEQKLTLQQKLLQKLSPQQIQVIKLLEIPTMQLEQRIKKELEENPVLEVEANAPVENENSDFDNENENKDTDNEEFSMEDYYEDEEIPTYKLNVNNYSKDDKYVDVPFSVGTSFNEFLNEQLNLSELSDEEKQLAQYILGNIDDDGYLRRDLWAISDDIAFSSNMEVSEQELEKILTIIHEFDPPGVGARDLRECLMLQLERKEEKEFDLARTIVSDFFNEFTKKHYEKILAKLELSEEELKEGIEQILKLNPKPGSSYSNPLNKSNQHIVPDFILEIVDGELSLSLNQRNVPELKINDTYSEMLKAMSEKQKSLKSDKEAMLFVKQKIDSGKWFIDAIQQRQTTLLLTMSEIINFQKEFFYDGDETKLKPMILKDIAERTNLDISTISRVSNSKYIQTHFGIYPLKYFFSEGLQKDDGEEVSTREIKKILKECIDNEDKHKPLTDEKLTAILKEKSYNIARRTVAKYREQLDIPVARLRKEL